MNVDPGSNVNVPSIFTLNSGTLSENNQIWSDGAHVTETASVTVNATGYNEYLIASNGYHIWTSNLLADAVTITNGGITTLYSTIQDAINAASDGDTINVAIGEYAGAVINKSVKVIGAEEGVSRITSGIPYKAGNNNLMSAFRPEVDGAEIRNFDIANGIDLGIYSVGVNNITVDSVIIRDTLQGITNWGGSYWTITKNIITNTKASNGGGIGIFVGAKAQQQSIGNLIQYNTINATAAAEDYSTPGIALTLDTRYGQYNLLNGTEEVSDNHILDNTIMASGANNGVGIEVGTILGNSDNDPDRTDPIKIAALMGAAALNNNIVEGNIIDGAETGIYFYIATNLAVTKNEVKNSGRGIYVEHAHSGISISNNMLPSLINNETTKIDATNNYWGTTNQTEIEGLVSGDVSFIPFCTDETCTASTLGSETSITVNVTTSSGTDVMVDLLGGQSAPGGVSVNFSDTAGGDTSVTLSISPPSSSSAPGGFNVLGNYFDLSGPIGTGTAIVCFTPTSGHVAANTQLLHFESGNWVDVTGSVDIPVNTVCSTPLSSLSPFVLATLVPATTTTTSGGGGGAAGGYCTTQWTCTAWSACTDGTQTRICSYPTNFCAPTAAKPAESQACSTTTPTTGEGATTGTGATTAGGGITGRVISNLGTGGTIAVIAIILAIVVAITMMRSRKQVMQQ